MNRQIKKRKEYTGFRERIRVIANGLAGDNIYNWPGEQWEKYFCSFT
ncbi:MAG: hypothetical protein GF417_05155 [Candidatus Latescibacteria bacterium]|nr:hypothetical protein [bacterium]MBD3423806.1 hypothetical protein [Candidatus Latescibacterota bacterium]